MGIHRHCNIQRPTSSDIICRIHHSHLIPPYSRLRSARFLHSTRSKPRSHSTFLPSLRRHHHDSFGRHLARLPLSIPLQETSVCPTTRTSSETNRLTLLSGLRNDHTA